MEKYIDYIDFIENTLTERLDTQIAYNEIQKIRTKYYGSSNNQVNINMAKYRDTKNHQKDSFNPVFIIYFHKSVVLFIRSCNPMCLHVKSTVCL